MKNKTQCLPKFFVFAVSLIFVISCKKKEPAIQPPFSELIPQFDTFQIDPAVQDTITIASGTRIIIPANALIDEEGNTITGEVDIAYREYHDALDIFLSGIPMHFTSREGRRQMKTAGLFEIRGSQNGTPVQLADDEEIEVRMASFEEGEGYNYFGFTEDKGKWEFLDYVAPRANPKRKMIRDSIKNIDPGLKVPFDKSYFVFNYNAIMDIYFPNDYKKQRQQKKNPALKRKVEKYGLTMYEIFNNDRIKYKGVYYPVALMVWKHLNGTFSKIAMQDTRPDVKKLYGNTYQATFEVNNKRYTYKMQCYMPLKYLLRLPASEWEKNYNEALAQIRKEEERLRNEAKVFRTAKISGFGVYNFDYLIKMDDKVIVKANFKLDRQIDNDMYELTTVYCMPGDNKTLVKLKKRNWDKMWLNPSDTNYRIYTVLPENKIALFPVEAYRKIDFEKLAQAENPSYTFTLEVQDEIIDSKETLKDLLKFN